MIRRLIVLSLWISSMVALAGGNRPGRAAPAVDRATAQAQFGEGRKHFQARRYRQALASFRAAHRAWNNRIFFFNIALAHARLGEVVPAARALRRYLVSASAREKRLPEELKRIQTQVGVVVVRAPVAGAEILLDGRRVGRGRVERIVRAGEHVIEIRHRDRTVDRKKLLVAGGQTERWSVSWRPGPRPRPVPRPGVTPRRRSGVHWAWFATITGLAAAAFGTAMGLYNETRQVNDRYLADTTRGDLRDRGLRLERATNALLGTSAALVVSAAVLAVFTRWRNPERNRKLSVGVGPLPGGGLVHFRLGLDF